MAESLTRSPATRAGAGRGGVLAALCLTEIISWGVLYYAFPVLAPSIAADTGWSLTSINAAFSLGLITAALVGIPVGRFLDRRGPRGVMTTGSVLAGIAVALIAWSPNLALFGLGWILAGTAMAGVLYQPAFTALTRWYQPRHLPALATLTLVAGLASTVFAPLTTELDAHLDWRTVYLVLGAGLLITTAPAHAWALRLPWPPDQTDQHTDQPDASYAASIRKTTRFRLLLLGLATGSLAMYAALISLVPLLLERGLSATTAAWILGLGGIGQVSGRLLYTLTAHRLSLRIRTGLVLTLGAISIAAFTIAPDQVIVLVALSMTAGIARGITTLLQATAITDRWGHRSYGHLSAILGAPVLAATALAPWTGATLAHLTGSYTNTYGILAAIAAIGAVLMILSAGSLPPHAGPDGTTRSPASWRASSRSRTLPAERE